MSQHNDWLKEGFDKGLFLLAGSIVPGRGGAILAAPASPDVLQEFIQKDPFVMHDVVSAETIEISPARAIPELEFLR